jgi:ubiquinone/menaquinone biosynthesis C-methylase UbiE
MNNIDNKRYLQSGRKVVSLTVDYKEMLILDIGGGGEGIIGKVYGRNVIAIDRELEELEETNNKSIKIVMDACEMKFASNQFDVTTSFFSLMYMNNEEKEKAILEINRVLKTGGVFEIWDTNVPMYKGKEQDIYVLKLQINLEAETINTGYGVLMDDKGQNVSDIKTLLIKSGFEIIEYYEYDSELYRIKCIKRLDIA